MKFTENFKLKKPEQTDSYNVEDFNENADVVDAKLKELADHLTVKDISSDFIKEMNILGVSIISKTIYKQGNIVSGSIILSDNNGSIFGGSSHEIFSISDSYKPALSIVVANVLDTPTADITYESRNDFIRGYIYNGLLYVDNQYASDNAFDRIFISFSYICQ